MNKHSKKILIGSFFISLLLWGSIFFFFPQEMTNDGLKKMLKENDNVYYLSNVKEKELPVATFSSQKRTNSSNFSLGNNSVTPMVNYTPLHVNVNVNNSVAAGMENYSSGALYSQNIVSPDPVSNGGGNLGIGLMAGLSSGRHSNSNRSEGSGLSSSVNLVEPFSNNTPSTLHRQLAENNYPYTENSGGTDPGGDPVGPPIPVGDGIGFLILLALGYGGIKMKLSFF
ncbi:MAG: hypothetical protein KBG25_04080 [Paludibacteraceae bacterium]|nr:hypothetical protein [Paludibacteraceae bacterium]